MSIHQALHFLVQNQVARSPISTPVATPVPHVVEPIRMELAQGATPNTINLSAA